MGIEITKDLLKKIYNNYDKNKDKIPQKEIKKVKLKGIDIFKNNVKNTYNKEKYIIKNEIKKEIDNKKESKNDDKDGEVNNKINNILFRKHKSFDNIFNKDFQKEFYLSNKDSHFNNNNSFDDNKSENSDYDDISNEPILLKRTIKKKENNIKSIKLRNSYYSKLIFSNILTYKKEPKITNIFIYDWDDTLMCTSFVAPAGILNLDDLKPADKTNMKNLDQLVSTLLTKSMEHGNVFIITNAAYGWVEYSAKKLYPMTYNILKNIKIVSARGMWEKKLPGDYRQWKSKAFIETIKTSNINFYKTANIISFGDSIIELEASHKLKEIFADGYIKTIKFKESPQPMELIKELKIITSQFDTITSNMRNLSVKVAKKKNE
jgi:hypothetical protein